MYRYNKQLMSDRTLLPLLLLYANSRERIDGTTRFQKLIFLAQQEGGLSSKYAFHAENFGPYSYDLAAEIDSYVEEGFIKRDTVPNEVGNEKEIYSLTTKGIKVAKSAVTRDAYDPIMKILTEIKTEHSETPLQELLRYVYRKYDEYATATELDTERLFDPDARSQFLEPDGEADYAGPSPEEAVEMNSSAEDVFSI